MPDTPSAAHRAQPTAAPATTGALSHIRVLDLSRVLAGPWCTQILADMGADVIKIEKPGEGDDTRRWGPPFLNDDQGERTDQASYYNACNRNKRSVTIDIATPQGQALIRQMALQSDVLVENFKVGGLQRYGLDYESLRALNPRLIYCSVTGFGQTGPYAERAGYDLMIQAMCGLMSVTGRADSEPGGGPMRVGVAAIDLFTGLYASTAILAALEARHQTGRGQHIDMALFDVGMSILANQAAGYLNTGAVPQRQGNSHPSLAPYQDFPSSDGAVLLAIGNDGQFARFCHAAGKHVDTVGATGQRRAAVDADGGIAELAVDLELAGLDLNLTHKIPDDTALILIPGQQGRVQPFEQELLRNYLQTRAGRIAAHGRGPGLRRAGAGLRAAGTGLRAASRGAGPGRRAAGSDPIGGRRRRRAEPAVAPYAARRPASRHGDLEHLHAGRRRPGPCHRTRPHRGGSASRCGPIQAKGMSMTTSASIARRAMGTWPSSNRLTVSLSNCCRRAICRRRSRGQAWRIRAPGKAAARGSRRATSDQAFAG